MNKHNQVVTAKMITGAETGGQVYGEGDFGRVKRPKIGLEVTLTLGAYQFYGNEGKQLLKMIKETSPNFPSVLEEYVADGFNWVREEWVPDDGICKCISDLISSDIGKIEQVKLFCDIQLPEYVSRAEAFGVRDDAAQMMWVEIEHVGGILAATRIFKRCRGDYSLDSIMSSLKQDQYDMSSDNQAGDKLYWTRHTFCRSCIERYADLKPKFVYVRTM